MQIARAVAILSFAFITFFSLATSSCDRHAGYTNHNAGALSGTANENRASKTPCVNLNTATAAELSELPGIGEVTARRIVDFRDRSGPFRRVEDVIIIEGFSEGKFRAIQDRICVD